MAVDSAGTIIALNARLATMLGYSQSELIGRTYEILLPASKRRQHNRLCELFLLEPLARPMGTGRDLSAICKDGSQIPVEIGLNYVATREGGLVVTTVIDISERTRAQKEEGRLGRAQAILQTFEQLNLPVAVIQHDRRVLRLNPGFEKIRSLFIAFADKMEFSNKTAQRHFVQALANLKAINTHNVRPHFSIAATNGQPAASVRLLPVGGTANSSLVVVMLKLVGSIEVASVDALREAFGLTPAEAKVAAHCAAGLPAWQVAERLGTSKETVRNQLKRIFRKMGVSSQSQLVSLLSTLSVP
jgi:PAS domain S-box-containing protein